jgi:alpha-glucosidase
MRFVEQLPLWTQTLHHDGSEAFVSNPNPSLGETIKVRLRVPQDAPVGNIFMRSVPDGEIKMVEMMHVEDNGRFAYYEADLVAHQPRNHYHFILMTTDDVYHYTAQGVSRAQMPDWHDFILLANHKPVDWVREAVFYQIFVDRFHNGDPSNDVQDGQYTRQGFESHKRTWGEEPTPWAQGGSMDFFGGDLQGITQKLDYLDDLGVNALYLCPVFLATSNHKYDINDFWQVDPHFGGDEALAELRGALDKKAMRIILDITTNHIGINNGWYQDVLQNPDAPHADYFAYDPDTGSIETWLGVPSLIKLDYTSEDLRDRMYRDDDSAMRHWLKAPYRMDGWRIDVANMTGNLRENQLDHDVFAEIRDYVKQDGDDVYLMGEHFHDGTPHIQGDELDASMNYMGFNTPMRRWIHGAHGEMPETWSFGDLPPMGTQAMAQQWASFMGATPYQVALQQFNQLDSHDTSRILHVAGGDKALVKLGLALMMAFPGTPCIYYGTEIGLDGGHDPYNRRCMPWDDSTWDKDLYAYTQKLITWRKQSDVVQNGGFQILYAEGDSIAFARYTQNATLIAIGNRGDATTLKLDVNQADIADGSILRDVISKASYNVDNGMVALSLAHGQALLLEVETQ